MNDRDASQVRGGQEARGVAKGSASDRDDRLGTLDPEPDELASGRLDDAEPLGVLPLRKEHSFDRPPAGGQPFVESGAGCRPCPWLRDQDRASSSESVERVVDAFLGDAVAELEQSDRGLDPQQGRGRELGRCQGGES